MVDFFKKELRLTMKGYLCVKVLWGVVSMMLYAEFDFFRCFLALLSNTWKL